VTGSALSVTEGDGRSLLGFPVRASGVRLGTVTAAWVYRRRVVLGLEVSSAWDADTRFLPVPAARVGNDSVTPSSLAFLTAAETAFYERNGAYRITLETPHDRFLADPNGVCVRKRR
jgi:hypothetical protein